jgi:hypothetical protein
MDRKAREAERDHLVLLLMGLLTTLHAMRIGWYGWAAALAVGNLTSILFT